MSSWLVDNDILYIDDEKIALLLPEARYGALWMKLERAMKSDREDLPLRDLTEMRDQIDELRRGVERLIKRVAPK